MGTYYGITEPEHLDYLRQRLMATSGQPIGFDTETTGLRRWHDTVVGFSISPEWGEAYYIPVAHEDARQLPHDQCREFLAELLRTRPVVCHGAAFDTVLAGRWVGIPSYSIEVAHCTLILAQVLGERSEAGKDTSAGLKHLAKKYLGVERPTFEDLFPPKTKQKDKDFRKVVLEVAVPYAAADADDVLGLIQVMEPLLDRADVRATYVLEVGGRMPGEGEHRAQGNVLHELLWMEQRGVAIDVAYAEQAAGECRSYADSAEAVLLDRLSQRLGRRLLNPNTKPKKDGSIPEEPINLNSGDQLQVILFDPAPVGLGLPVVKMTPPSTRFPQGNRSTDESVLERLAVHEPALMWLLEMRAARKAAGTYFDPVPAEHVVWEQDYTVEDVPLPILHPNYKQNGTETGRTASDDPNVQNWPKEQVIGVYGAGAYKGQPLIPGIDPITVNARNMVVPRPGFYILEMDWDQVEYRAIAGFSQDPGLLEVFANNIDVHKQTYALMYGVPVESVDKPQRQDGKTMNYALNFGAGEQRVAGMLGTSVEDARTKIARYKAALPLVALWKESIEEFAKRHHYVQTAFGRKRWLNFGGQGVSEAAARKSYFAALREAVNMPVQGTCADLLKITLVRLGPWLRAYFPDVRTILTTHDSITFEVPDTIEPGYFAEAVRPVVEFQAGFIPGWPTISAQFGWGDRWGDLDESSGAVAPLPVAAATATAPVHLDTELRLRRDLQQDEADQLAALLGTLAGTGRLLIRIPNGGGTTIEVPDVAVGPSDGHLFAHIFAAEDYTLGSPAEMLGQLVGGSA